MSRGTGPRLRFFENAPGQRHITEADRHLYASDAPRYRLGIVGTGTMGQEHMRVAALLGQASIHGIYDSSAHSATVAAEQHEALTGARPLVYDSLDALCADEALDAIFICTPNHTHLNVLKRVMASELPLFLEKPMATTLADAAALIALAADYPAALQVGLQYRFKAVYAEAHGEAITRGALGGIRTLSMSEYRPPFLDKVGQWNKFNANSGGTLVEKCCHYFDLMQSFAGAPVSQVFASGGQAVNFLDFEYAGAPADIADHGFVILDYENGVRGSFALNMFSPHFFEELVVCGDQGRLVATERFDFLQGKGLESRLQIERPEPGISRDSQIAYPRLIEESGHSGATYFEHQAFVELLQQRRSNAATLLDGLWSLITAAAAQQSMATRRAVIIEEFIRNNGLGETLERAQKWNTA